MKLATWNPYIGGKKVKKRERTMHRLGVGAEAMSVANRMRARAHNPGTKARVAVLGALVTQRDYSSDFCFTNFDWLSEQTGLQRRVVRLAARALARDGLAVYGAGLWTESGDPAGAGYAATMLGATVYKILTPE